MIPCLGNIGIDLPAYRDAVLQCVSKPHIQDINQRVATDGFFKIPAMITPRLLECYQWCVTLEAKAMLPALLFVFMARWHKGVLPYEYQDGILDSSAIHTMFNSAGPVVAYARNTAQFGELA